MPSHYARVPTYRVVHNVLGSMRHCIERVGSFVEVAKMIEASQKASDIDVLQFCSLAVADRTEISSGQNSIWWRLGR